jgi:hypothetical protein
MLPYSRIESLPGNVMAEKPTEVLMVDRALLGIACINAVPLEEFTKEGCWFS